MSIDLSFAKQIVAELATDTCTIQRDQGTSDDTFDPNTGTWTKTGPTTTYTGACMVRDSTNVAAGRGVEGAVEGTEQRWVVKLPDLTADVAVGDLVTITASVNDPRLVGRRFVVADIGGGTFKVSRTLLCTAWVSGGDSDWGRP